MGLASSQARILLLTARKSDLEYRAQAISQRKMNIAMQTQQLATEYSTAMSNRRMSLITYTDQQTGQTIEKDLTYAQLMAGSADTGDFLVMSANGKCIVTGGTQEEKDEYAYIIAKKLYNAGTLPEGVSKAELMGVSSKKEFAEKYAKFMETVDAAQYGSILQNGLRNGSFYLMKADHSAALPKYETVAWSGLSCINDKYDTSDDAAAQAHYESQSMILANQDKMLDLELQQIETQHKAIETEYDSVKKVIENNIKVSFKIFS